MRSALIVGAQFALLVALLLTTPWAWPTVVSAPPGLQAACGLLFALSIAVGGASIVANPPGNFNIRPEIKDGARLVTGGIYHWIRHPIYVALLVGAAGCVVAAPLAWRVAAWFALLAVLVVKIGIEERHLKRAFAEYADYARRTARLVPGLY